MELADAAECCFTAPDEQSARACAAVLSSYGYARVYARKVKQHWLVVALDIGPYTSDVLGERAIYKLAAATKPLVENLGAQLLSAGERSETSVLFPTPSDAIVELRRPGCRPPAPQVAYVPPPPAMSLSMDPDLKDGSNADLAGLDDIPWAQLEHAHGAADNIPGIIRQLSTGRSEIDATTDELLGDYLFHQGNLYSATAAAMPFLMRIAAAGALRVEQRVLLYMHILGAANSASTTSNSSHGRDVLDAITLNASRVFAPWMAEPPLIRFVLAGLAALCPEVGQEVKQGVRALQVSCAGTQVGAYVSLAMCMLDNNIQSAFLLAQDIVDWDLEQYLPSFEDSSASELHRIRDVLVHGVINQSSRILDEFRYGSED